jgi:hypothetical protein
MSVHESMRNEARKAFKDAGLTYANLTPTSMQRLRILINDRMKASGLILGTFRCRQRGIVKETKWGRYGELRCKADYFDNREAITFNTNGFIGFAGWADNENVQPILEGFREWVRELRADSATERKS